eukprot:354266-Chlamydomonas_euryale.AAC.19
MIFWIWSSNSSRPFAASPRGAAPSDPRVASRGSQLPAGPLGVEVEGADAALAASLALSFSLSFSFSASSSMPNSASRSASVRLMRGLGSSLGGALAGALLPPSAFAGDTPSAGLWSSEPPWLPADPAPSPPAPLPRAFGVGRGATAKPAGVLLRRKRSRG